MIFLSEIVTGGITTVIGVLGVDTTMKTIAGLLGHVKGLRQEGISTRMWSGGYNVPPITVLASIREDMMFIDEVVGYGEIALSDHRSLQVDNKMLAMMVLDTHIGGLLSGKAGISHFHIGESNKRLQVLFELINNYEIEPGWLYPTHITRSTKLLDEAIELTKKGGFADIDTIDGKLAQSLKYYLTNGGKPANLTISSDCGLKSPATIWQQLRHCYLEANFELTQLLPLVTINTAKLLKLESKGRLASGMDGDVLVMKRDSLEIVELIAMGKRLIKNGKFIGCEHFLRESDREIKLTGAEK